MWSKELLKRCYTVARMIPCAMLGRPLWAFVWVTRQCKQDCRHCYVHDKSKPHMDFEVYRRAIDKLKDLGIVFIAIFGGEPTLHPQLIDMIKYARSKGRKVFLSIDVTVVTTELLREIVKVGTDIICFSLDKVEPSEGNRRAIESVDSKIDTISALNAKGYHCVLHCNITWHKANIHEAKEVIEYLHTKGNIGISVRPVAYPFPTSRISEQAKSLLLDSEDAEYIRELITWVIEKKKQGYLILNPYSYLENFPEFVLGNHKWDCGAFRDILSIDVDGMIMQCSYFLQDIPEPFKPISGRIEDLTFRRIREYRAIVQHNLRYCNTKCYSPVYFCTSYYRTNMLEVLKYYLNA